MSYLNLTQATWFDFLLSSRVGFYPSIFPETKSVLLAIADITCSIKCFNEIRIRIVCVKLFGREHWTEVLIFLTATSDSLVSQRMASSLIPTSIANISMVAMFPHICR